jgi:molybdopterin/thiamine biosynthesis adenylyltransferase
MKEDILEDAFHLILCGAGGIGTNAAIAFAHSKLPAQTFTMTLIDPDQVEQKNLNRLPYKKHIGQQKVLALRDYIKENVDASFPIMMHGAIAEEALEEAIKAVEPYGGKIFVLDCTDSLNAQRFIYRLCETLAIEYARIGNENQFVHIEFNRCAAINGFGEDPPEGYTNTQTNMWWVYGTVHMFWEVFQLQLHMKPKTGSTYHYDLTKFVTCEI